MSVLKINQENFEKEVLQAQKTVIIDFFADWCGPCKMMAPIIEEIAEETKENVVVGKINVDENQNLATQYAIMSIPTILVIKEGEVKNRFVGVTSKNEILEAIK